MGLISRVSSRTYRGLCKYLKTIHCDMFKNDCEQLRSQAANTANGKHISSSKPTANIPSYSLYPQLLPSLFPNLLHNIFHSTNVLFCLFSLLLLQQFTQVQSSDINVEYEYETNQETREPSEFDGLHVEQ